MQDLAALIDVAGMPPSTGTPPALAVALEATLSGLSVDRGWSGTYAPYLLEPSEDAKAYHDELHRLLAAGQPGEAVAGFLRQVGMPEEMITGMQASPSWPATESVGSAWPTTRRRWVMSTAAGCRTTCRQVQVPTLILVGGADFGFMIDTG